MRATPDVAFAADQAHGVEVYYTPLDGSPGLFITEGGTSVGAPAVAAYIAVAGASANVLSQMYAKANLNSLLYRDVLSGSTGGLTKPCQAAMGFDCATGLGTPTGIAAF